MKHLLAMKRIGRILLYSVLGFVLALLLVAAGGYGFLQTNSGKAWLAATLSRGLRRQIPRPLWYMFAFALLMAFDVPFAVNNAWAFWGFRDFTTLVLGGVLPLAMLPRDLRDVRRLATVYVLCVAPERLEQLFPDESHCCHW